MKKLAVSLVFTSLLVYRLVTGQPERLPEGSRVKLVIPTIDYPLVQDNRTGIVRGVWEVWVRGYTEFMPGDLVVVEGVVDKYGRVVEAEVLRVEEARLRGIDYWLVKIAQLRHWAVARLGRILPEPHASLAVGILLGVRAAMPREFYESLVESGTLHLVAASGYNVAVVAAVIVGLLQNMVGIRVASIVGMVGVGGYVVLAGGSAAVVRAGVMGTLVLLGQLLGRMHEGKVMLIWAVVLMLLVSPGLVKDVGFQLSVMATAGILWIGGYLTKRLAQTEIGMGVKGVIKDYLVPTVAATIATAPVIWWHFGRVSLLGIGANLLLLPLVPLIMLLTSMSLVWTGFGYLLYVPLWWMVVVIRSFG